MVFDGSDDTERRHVGEEVDQHVVHYGGESLRRTVQHAEHDVPRLRNGRVGKETFDVPLTDGEQVAHHNGRHRNHPQDIVPDTTDVAEYMMQRQQQHETTRRFGNYRKVGCGSRRCPFIDIGSPHMERHERNLESQSGKEEDESQHRHEIGAHQRLHVGEIHRPHRTVEI